MVGLHAQTLRYYERVGLVMPSRSGGPAAAVLHGRAWNGCDASRPLPTKMGVNLAGAEVALKLIDRINDLEAQVASLTDEVVRLRAANNSGTRRPQGRH